MGHIRSGTHRWGGGGSVLGLETFYGRVRPLPRRRSVQHGIDCEDGNKGEGVVSIPIAPHDGNT